MNIPYFQVDAFTRVPFKGNPAGICLLEAMPDDTLLTAIAAENNLSETAFLLPEGAGYRLRWFSPLVEIPLCGHATLASAHMLWENGLALQGAPISFYTLSGTLTAYQEDGWIVLDFPARSHEPATLPDALKPLFKEAVQVTYSVDRYIVELPSGGAVATFVPDPAILRSYRCIITGKADAATPYDFISRYFAGPVGVDEDPVTGSAHCSLASYWAERLHKNEFLAWQASKRGGELKVTLRGDRVLLKGEAVTVLKGQFSI
ncbi:PhzF family phenazine biosynthesis protein [Chitinophaga sp. Ak27]|uniref:PhzF family phenazine biosynthesis protein n=1 Tax=Chitinophaga sp. Ak27 TaxID=2726116 RepID=UPI00145F6236|nr:PhzF family phenazine biosynthesis protein [Chitinophaga sp. Ak27]NLU90338.1 PhzF family phenazine biosynthesis protein [Chitinophaga sp. Ak27]